MWIDLWGWPTGAAYRYAADRVGAVGGHPWFRAEHRAKPRASEMVGVRAGSRMQRRARPPGATLAIMTMPLSVMPTRPSHCRSTCAVAVPSLRSLESSISITPSMIRAFTP